MTSRLEELIAELCPNGVEYKVLGELCNICTGKLNANAKDEDGIYPFFTCDANPYKINEYAFDTSAILISGNGSQVGHLNQYEGKFNAYQRTYVLDNFKLVIKPFLFHFMDAYLKPYIMVNCKKGSVPYITLPMLQSFNVPVPPLEVQREIVRILDSFTLLTAELTAELTARKKQYEYYRDTLLTFNDNNPLHSLIQRYCPNGVEYKALEYVASYSKNRIDSQILDEHNYVGVENLLQNKQGKTLANSIPKESKAICFSIGDVLIGNIRPYLKKIWFADCVGGTNGDVLVIHIHDKNVISPRFLYHILSSERFFLYDVRNSKGAKMPRGDKKAVMQFEIPLPPLEVQRQIVQILDRFDALCNDLTQGLPAEIEARRKQYEYYRDQFLTFKRA